ncbi:MAG: hypothetical protein AB2L14_28970 [Candidatus Xenobiia bacterium LiM19]
MNTLSTMDTSINTRTMKDASVAKKKETNQEEPEGLFDRFTDGVGALAGTITGAASIPLHVIPGAVKGASEALTSHKGLRNATPFHGTFVLQNLMLGVGAGIAYAGVVGAVTGAAASSALTMVLEKKAEKTNSYEKMIETIENKVDRINAEHPGENAITVIANTTEGTLIGAYEAAKTGARVGFDLGFGTVKSIGNAVEWVSKKVLHAAERTVGDTIAGLAEGVYETGKGIVKNMFNQAEPMNPERKGLRRLVGGVFGTPLGLASMAASAASGTITGGFTGLAHEGSGLNLFVQKACSILGCAAAGGAAGTVVGGPAGTLIGGIGGALYGALTQYSDASEKIAGNTEKKVLNATGDNDQNAYFMKKTVKDFTEGTLTGGVYSGAGGFGKGIDSGAGILSGLVDGAKGFAGALAGNYEKEETLPPPESSTKKGFLKKIASLPVNLLKATAGTIVGTCDSAMSMIDGAIQGSSLALSGKEKASSGFRELVIGTGTVLAAGAAAFVIGGGLLPAMAGGIAATCGAALIHKINEKTGAAEKTADGLTSAVRHSLADNSYLNKADEKKNVYELFRDGTECALTGAGAGIREGFREGYNMGSGFVDGAINTISDLGGRLAARGH